MARKATINRAMTDKPGQQSTERGAAERRRAEALRENLRRRKEQGRARSQQRPEPALPAAAVLDFWFGPAGDPERASFRERWFKVDPAFDGEIAARFGPDVERALAGAWNDAVDGPHDTLALVILLDQFPRNMFRGTAGAFAGDAFAKALAERAIGAAWDRQLQPVERLFLYLPLEHSEALADQERALALFAALPESPWYAKALDAAQRHHAIIARFGRFPHRNKALGRASTTEEIAFLATPGSSF